jgi:hypothetical protein
MPVKHHDEADQPAHEGRVSDQRPRRWIAQRRSRWQRQQAEDHDDGQQPRAGVPQPERFMGGELSTFMRG